MSGRKSRCREQPSQDCGVNRASCLPSLSEGLTVACHAGEKWVRQISALRTCYGVYCPQEEMTCHWFCVQEVWHVCSQNWLRKPSCHPCSSLCWQGFISQNSIISKPWKMDLEQGKDLLSWLANSSVSFFSPLKSEEELFDSQPIFRAEKTCREVRHLPGVTIQQQF